MEKASREFQVFVKPAGAACNLHCRYCYYLKKKNLYPQVQPFRMPDDLLEAYIVQHIEAYPGPVINFSWHGGEPTVLGLDYFRKIVALQRKHRPAGRILSKASALSVLRPMLSAIFFAPSSMSGWMGISVELKYKYSKKLPEQPLGRSIRSVSSGKPAVMYRSLNTTETSIRVITLLTRNIAWETFRTPTWWTF